MGTIRAMDETTMLLQDVLQTVRDTHTRLGAIEAVGVGVEAQLRTLNGRTARSEGRIDGIETWKRELEIARARNDGAEAVRDEYRGYARRALIWLTKSEAAVRVGIGLIVLLGGGEFVRRAL